MGDIVMRISMMIQQGYLCQRCGVELDGQITDCVRSCSSCRELEEANLREESADLPRNIVRVPVAQSATA
jgi:hypothetical protein